MEQGRHRSGSAHDSVDHQYAGVRPGLAILTIFALSSELTLIVRVAHGLRVGRKGAIRDPGPDKAPLRPSICSASQLEMRLTRLEEL